MLKLSFPKAALSDLHINRFINSVLCGRRIFDQNAFRWFLRYFSKDSLESVGLFCDLAWFYAMHRPLDESLQLFLFLQMKFSCRILNSDRNFHFKVCFESYLTASWFVWFICNFKQSLCSFTVNSYGVLWYLFGKLKRFSLLSGRWFETVPLSFQYIITMYLKSDLLSVHPVRFTFNHTFSSKELAFLLDRTFYVRIQYFWTLIEMTFGLIDGRNKDKPRGNLSYSSVAR